MALEEAKRTTGSALIVVSTMQTLKNVAGWSKLGPLFDELAKSKSATYDGVKFEVYASRQSRYSWDGPAVVLYGSQDLLDSVDALHGNIPTLSVSWIPDDHRNWVATWGAADLDNPAGAAKPTKPTHIADVALNALHGTVNVSTGISHPSDYKLAVRVLETLYHKNVAITHEEIRQRLIQLGWHPKSASKVSELAEKIFAGRRVKESKNVADERLWTYWNSQEDSLDGEEG